jgi:hypothetical protein
VEQTDRPFCAALRDLLIENDYATRRGRPNWAAFAAELDNVHYETLRRAATGRCKPSLRLMEECARVLRIPSDYFLEYRAQRAQQEFDPRHVGVERAVRNLDAWSRTRERFSTE